VKLWNRENGMKNITVSVDDEVYRLARIRAAEQSTSVSALVKRYLNSLTGRDNAETEFERLAREEEELRAELSARRLGLNPAFNLSRDDLHDRDALR
jgi:hypothetical protein